MGSSVVLIFPIAFVILVGLLIPLSARAERRALAEAEREFANDPAGLERWKQQRAARRRRAQAQMRLNQQANLAQQQLIQEQLLQQQIAQNLTQQQIQQTQAMNNMGMPGGMPPGS